ncbi:MAG TPA: hypothetical protein VHP61_03465 [Acidobacteriota bacterium]|nr:hypothetical protein [Acidobacteriota bacterium]
MERVTEIYVILENKPSVLGDLCGHLAEAGINIEYCYGTLARKGDRVSVIMDVSNIERAIQVLGG